MSELQKEDPGFTVLGVMSTVLVIITLGLIVFLVFDRGAPVTTGATTNSSGSSSGTSANPYAILSPATVPSKTVECSQQTTYDSNGNSGPVQCANGDLNVQEWNILAAIEPTVLTLGYNPSLTQVQSALCADAGASNSDANTKNSYVVEGTVYQIAALYYGWTFSTDPAAVLTGSGC